MLGLVVNSMLICSLQQYDWCYHSLYNFFESAKHPNKFKFHKKDMPRDIPNIMKMKRDNCSWKLFFFFCIKYKV